MASKTLYRFFDTADHADALTRGEVWISTFETLRRYENEHQGDAEEGFLYYKLGTISGLGSDPAVAETARRMGINVSRGAKLTIVGGWHKSYVPDAFILCTTRRFDPVAFAGWWGTNYCCEISNGHHFFGLVTERLQSLFGSRLVNTAMGDVIYRSRGYAGLEDSPGPIGFVKPTKYKGQEEVRMTWDVPRLESFKPFGLAVPGVLPLCRRIL